MKKLNKITGTAIFGAIIIVLQLIANYLPAIGGVSITLALFPIALGAIIYGPISGLILGFINGIIVLTAPSTLTIFFTNYPWQTILICLLKTSIAGFVAGLIFKAFKGKHTYLAVTLAAISVPLVNTGLFSISMLTLHRPLLDQLTNAYGNGYNAVGYLFLIFIGMNFLIEFVINVALVPTTYKLTNLLLKNK